MDKRTTLRHIVCVCVCVLLHVCGGVVVCAVHWHITHKCVHHAILFIDKTRARPILTLGESKSLALLFALLTSPEGFSVHNVFFPRNNDDLMHF